MKEDNKLIAKFMSNNAVNSPHLKTERELKYHSSWDWLMPVVEKIEFRGCIVEIWMSLGVGCRIVRPLKNDKSWETLREGNDLFEVVYDCVMDFIKWDNKK